jgi:hypothetical protein
MGLFSTENELRVEVIGSDGVRRTGFIPRTDTVAFSKYLITSKDIFLVKMKKFDLLPFVQPTICFREDSIHAIPRESESSFPTPAETGDAIAGAAWALAKLLVSKEEKWKLILMLLCALAVMAGAGSAYMSYNTNLALKEFTTSYTSAPGTIVPTSVPTMVVTSKPTIKPGTPGPTTTLPPGVIIIGS